MANARKPSSPKLQTQFGELRGLARTGLARNYHNLMGRYGALNVLTTLNNRKLFWEYNRLWNGTPSVATGRTCHELINASSGPLEPEVNLAVAQFAAQYFTDVGFGQLLAKLNALRHLVGSEMLTAIGGYIRLGQRGIFANHKHLYHFS